MSLLDRIVPKNKLQAKKIKQMVKDRDFSFLLDLDNEKLVMLCDKYSSQGLVEELFKLDFDKGEAFVKYVVDNYLSKPYVNTFMSLLLKYDASKTLDSLKSEKRNSSYLNKIVDLGDYENNANVLLDNVDKEFFYNIDRESILYETFLYTLSYIKKDHQNAFLNRWKLKNLSFMSEKQIEVLANNIKNISFNELMREYLMNRKVLSNYVYLGEEEFVLELLNSNIYDEKQEQKLLEKLNSDSKTVEEEIVKMHKNNVEVKEFSLYQNLLIEMYARKKLAKNGVSKVSVNMFSNIAMKGKCSYRCFDECFSIDVNKNYSPTHSIKELLLILEHEITHVLQEKRRLNMDVIKDEDIDLYSKDHFIKNVANHYIISDEYYEFNYNEYSEEYMAEVTAYFETLKLLENDNICYQNIKDNFDNIVNTNYSWDTSRFFYSFKTKHINDLFEEQLNIFIKEKNGEMDTVETIIKKEAPLLLFEYDIRKQEIPRRRTIDELLDIIYDSEDKKVKQICISLLINRFNECKEKKDDFENNVLHLEQLIKNKKIDSKLAELLLNSIKRNPKKEKSVKR